MLTYLPIVALCYQQLFRILSSFGEEPAILGISEYLPRYIFGSTCLLFLLINRCHITATYVMVGAYPKAQSIIFLLIKSDGYVE